MKFFRPVFLSLLAAALAGSVSAQPAKTPVVKAVETARVAYVNSAEFGTEGTGIKQLVKAMQNLQAEFTTTESELSLLTEKLRTIVGELQKLNGAATPDAKAIEEKQQAGLALQKELQTKQQAAQQAFAARQQEVQGPIAAEIGKELRAFAKERDISMLFDIAKIGDAVIDAKPELDLTADFIAQFNAKHP